MTRYLRVLGVPGRVQLLRLLQVPHALSDIELPASRRSAAGLQTRRISRQAVSEHLESLETLGLISAAPAQRGGRRVTEYTLDPARVFVVADELRRISLLRPSVLPGTAAPSMTAAGAAVQVPRGPTLVLATGPMEGAFFELGGPGPWEIGRDREAQVQLTYDPFVSKRNSRIEKAAGGFLLTDLAGSRNGTRLNWRALESPTPARLENGDAIGVGRSLLFVRGL